MESLKEIFIFGACGARSRAWSGVSAPSPGEILTFVLPLIV